MIQEQPALRRVHLQKVAAPFGNRDRQRLMPRQRSLSSQRQDRQCEQTGKKETRK